MFERSSLGSQLKQDLLNNLSVSITAAVLAVLALAALTATDPVGGALFLAVNIAVFIPYAYEAYWPVEYDSLPAAVWTVSAALITAGLYIGFHVLFEQFVSPEFVEVAAFIGTVGVQYGITALYASVRNTT
ncbi:hypothetical protein GL213_04635 [Halogeometricum borinquense]|uniref:Uncharacterized protein n=1 Tax=Halogeometricum borinquense (strain ATCC 700274 / DSM 11551 / JCM 10706 / KCTC 4070 / PR3) TaxID=469382 RepID=E4NPG6_HALBP|nr:hypothetical protein [Halogeometricum borinquense]ADQ66521.1 hypothetical protein Hbor_09270 [Halogeometricum borinquense DSM 11551]ELY30996.1 hypothetical protein C499_02152 [Halogeometricum borinquense DSM 11551]QIQ75867.1 hypothetical protein GL213_04635 [Halogeometricum borinquense]